MEFYFKRMDFDDIPSITNYGLEVLEEVRTISRSDRNLINVDMKNNNLNRYIKQISSLSIDDEINKRVDENTPLTISTLDKIMNIKLVNLLLPGFIKNKVSKHVEEIKEESEQPINSMELFNTVMDAVDNIGIELQNNYNDAQAVVETLKISKSEIVQLIEKLDMVINVGNEDLEKYQNSDIDDPLKFKKIELATKSLISLKKSKNQLSVSLQEKDLKIINLSGEIVAIMDWMVTGYPALSHQVENRIETKYISNRINDLIELNETTNKIILDGANELKTTTTNTMELLKKGSLDVATLNSYLKTVQEALKPVQGYIENKENIEKKLIAELDRMDQEIMKNNEVLGLISSSNVTPSIEAPKKLTLEMKNSNNA